MFPLFFLCRFPPASPLLNSFFFISSAFSACFLFALLSPSSPLLSVSLFYAALLCTHPIHYLPSLSLLLLFFLSSFSSALSPLPLFSVSYTILCYTLTHTLCSNPL